MYENIYHLSDVIVSLEVLELWCLPLGSAVHPMHGCSFSSQSDLFFTENHFNVLVLIIEMQT